MSKLGAYPGDPPEGNDLISPEEEKVWEILEAAGIADEVNEKVMVIVRELAIKAAHEYVCQICERRAIERETEDIKMAGQEIELPKGVAQHQADYIEGAWETYHIWELGMWVHLLHKRATHRRNTEKKRKDLTDALNYLDMMKVQVEDLLGEL